VRYKRSPQTVSLIRKCIFKKPKVRIESADISYRVTNNKNNKYMKQYKGYTEINKIVAYNAKYSSETNTCSNSDIITWKQFTRNLSNKTI